MNFKTFFAMLARDAHVARRNLIPILIQTLFQPLIFVFIFGQVMTRGGLLPAEYKTLLLPGIVAISMVLSGIWSVAIPLIGEFQFSREIEDRLLAPIRIEWVAIEKVAYGMLLALVAGLVVIPAAWLLMGMGAELDFGRPLFLAALSLLVALMAAAGGLLLGSTVGQMQIGLMFTLVVGPMIFFGCAYYPWSTLDEFPILQKVVLINPLVYAAEGFRGALVPTSSHLPLPAILVALLLTDLLLLALGIRQFRRKAIG